MKKHCKKCNKTLDKSLFYSHKLTKDGLRTYCIACTKLDALQYARNNPDKVNRSHSLWRKNNTEKSSRYTKTYRKKNPGIAYQWRKLYLSRNPGINAHNCMKRHAGKMERTPPWANHKKIQRIYELAAWASNIIGEPLHVDHIVPLRGEKISGLHVETNLQIIPAIDNMRKGNKWT